MTLETTCAARLSGRTSIRWPLLARPMGERTAATITASGMSDLPRALKRTLMELAYYAAERRGDVVAPAVAHVFVGKGVLVREPGVLQMDVGAAARRRAEGPRDGCVEPVTIALDLVGAAAPAVRQPLLG